MNQRQKDFTHNYFLTNSVKESAIKAGYSAHCASVLGSRLLKHPAVKAELERLRAEKDAKFNQLKEQLSRESFVETAWRNFQEEQEPTLRPRWFELCGKALGYLTPKELAPQITNQTLIVNMDNEKLSTAEKWAKLRDLLANDTE